jgi:hypothetical protein
MKLDDIWLLPPGYSIRKVGGERLSANAFYYAQFSGNDISGPLLGDSGRRQAIAKCWQKWEKRNPWMGFPLDRVLESPSLARREMYGEWVK